MEAFFPEILLLLWFLLQIFVFKCLGILTCVSSNFSSAYDADGNLCAVELCGVSANCPTRASGGLW